MSEPAHANTRPRPINEAAKSQQITTAVGTIITALAAVGVLTLDQSNALQVVLTVVAPVAAAATGVLAAFGVVKKAEPHVTPVADPRDATGAPLATPEPPL